MNKRKRKERSNSLNRIFLSSPAKLENINIKAPNTFQELREQFQLLSQLLNLRITNLNQMMQNRDKLGYNGILKVIEQYIVSYKNVILKRLNTR